MKAIAANSQHAPAELRLEPCPTPEQVMPPAEPERPWSFAVSLLGNTIGGAILLLVLLSLPAAIAVLLPPL